MVAVGATLLLGLLSLLPPVPAPPGMTFECGEMTRTTLLDVPPFVLVVAGAELALFGEHIELQRSDRCVGLYAYTYGPVRCTLSYAAFDAHLIAYYSSDGCHAWYLVRLPQPG